MRPGSLWWLSLKLDILLFLDGELSILLISAVFVFNFLTLHSINMFDSMAVRTKTKCSPEWLAADQITVLHCSRSNLKYQYGAGVSSTVIVAAAVAP